MTSRASGTHGAVTAAIAIVLAGSLSACSQQQGYFPLEVGDYWEYGVAVTKLGETTTHRQVHRVRARQQADAGDTVVFEKQNGHFRYLRVNADGVERLGVWAAGSETEPKMDAAPVPQLPASTNPGTSWTVPSRLRLIESKAFGKENKLYYRYLPVTVAYETVAVDSSVKTPAGRFENCLLVKGVGEARVPVDRNNAIAYVQVEHMDWYAPGIGLVKSTRAERSESVFLTDGTFSMELLRWR